MTHLHKNLFRALAAMLALLLCLSGGLLLPENRSTAAAEEEAEIVSSYPYTTVTRVNVNLRKGRSVNTELIRRIPQGAEITVTEKNGNWAHVKYGSNTGWVRTEYIVLKTVKKVKVTPTPTPIPTLSPEEDAGGYEILRRGSQGTGVICLQEALIELGFLKGTADGKFGEATEKAVIAFQKKNQYPDTGLVDANLQAFLYSGKPLNAKGTAVKVMTVSPAAGSSMKLNNTGTMVSELQQMLADLGYYKGQITGKYDAATKSAVTAFQKKNGLKADGIAGAETRRLVGSAAALPADATPTPVVTPTPTPTPAPVWVIPKTTVQSGSKGADAKNVQTRLKELGYYRGKVDGNFGRASVNALKSFQANNGLKADGIAGKGTYAVLYSADAVPFAVEETPTPTPTAAPASPGKQGSSTVTWETLREGMKGTNVKQLQENLIELGYLTGKADGVYGAKTVAAVRAFQKANGLPQDGAAGKKTLTLLYSGTAKPAQKAASATPAPTAAVSGTLRQGSTGKDVRTLQEKLIALGYLKGKADGIYGRKTTDAVKAFQRDNKLKTDGVAGAKTMQQLQNAGPATKAPAATATPAPTAPPVTAAVVSGRPNASRVVYANWYTTVKDVCRRYPYATVYDFATGISWQIHIFSVGAHADFEPVTANDTARMNKAFGGETTWTPKPVWVIFSDGSVYIGSVHNTPHGTSHNTENNFAGHACLHFPRTQEQVTSIGPYATSHQTAIDKGWGDTRKMTY